MVSIQRLPPSLHSPQKPRSKQPDAIPAVPTQPSVVAKAVARSVRDPQQLKDAHARVQYDQPEGRHRQALDAYMGVMYQGRKDELAALVGVDVYV